MEGVEKSFEEALRNAWYFRLSVVLLKVFIQRPRPAGL